MAKKSMMVKAQKKRAGVSNSFAHGNKPKMATKAYNDCGNCGRTRAYFRFFGLCRICLREEARNGRVPGLQKASW